MTSRSPGVRRNASPMIASRCQDADGRHQVGACTARAGTPLVTGSTTPSAFLISGAVHLKGSTGFKAGSTWPNAFRRAGRNIRGIINATGSRRGYESPRSVHGTQGANLQVEHRQVDVGETLTENRRRADRRLVDRPATVESLLGALPCPAGFAFSRSRPFLDRCHLLGRRPARFAVALCRGRPGRLGRLWRLAGRASPSPWSWRWSWRVADAVLSSGLGPWSSRGVVRVGLGGPPGRRGLGRRPAGGGAWSSFAGGGTGRPSLAVAVAGLGRPASRARAAENAA